jgi:Flp pilus assembly protein TadD
VAKNDLGTAKPRATEYAAKVASRKVPFEMRQQHELAGLIALAENRASVAVEEFARANQQDPRILYLTGMAWQAAGDSNKAAAFFRKAADFNGLSFNYAYVRAKAKKPELASTRPPAAR